MKLIKACPHCGQTFSFLDWLFGRRGRHVALCAIVKKSEGNMTERQAAAAPQEYPFREEVLVEKRTTIIAPPPPPKRPAVSSTQASSMAVGALLGGSLGMVAGLGAAALMEREAEPEPGFVDDALEEVYEEPSYEPEPDYSDDSSDDTE